MSEPLLLVLGHPIGVSAATLGPGEGGLLDNVTTTSV